MNPDFCANSSSSFNVSFRESSEPSKITVVSSAYCVKIKSLLLIFIPLIFSLFLIFMANISAQSINIYGEIGSTCLQPRSVLKKKRRDYLLDKLLPVYFHRKLIYPLDDRGTKVEII